MNEIDASSGSIFWTASAATSCFPNQPKNKNKNYPSHIYFTFRLEWIRTLINVNLYIICH